ncbi:MAG: hypothetical protein AAF196_08805 [Planctomycetota bacterium]
MTLLRLSAGTLGSVFCLTLGTPMLQAQEAATTTFDPATEVTRGIEILLEMQEGEGEREWPYEGVYRTNENGKRRVIPIGYRVGGTSIASTALLAAPGYDEDKDRQKAVGRALEFVLEALELPLMQPTTRDMYDVRGWGQIYALQFLLTMQDHDAVPKKQAKTVSKSIDWLVESLVETALPEKGGWNYAGRRAPSPFMTGPGLLALFHAKERGHEVPTEVLELGLDALERGRAKNGSILYSAPPQSISERVDETLPGAIGRMVSVESTLWLAGRGSQEGLKLALDSFFEHWGELEKRRQQTGTHVRPYGVAPYYFIYAHHYASLAISLIEDEETQAEYLSQFHARLQQTREEDGGWNDRVFARSRNYGTAVSILALCMQDTPRPCGYESEATETESSDETDGDGGK